MKKFYALLLMVFAVAMGVSAQTYYNGKLDVEMVGEKIADGMDARVSLSESADGTYVFKLPDFRITINETELPCGDIVVEGVTRKDGKLSGLVKDLSLAMGQIHAKVDLVGTETAEGAMDLAITVGWYTDYPDDLSATMPINVTFKGQKYDAATLSPTAQEKPDNPVLAQARAWLDAYFEGRDPGEIPPCAPRGSEFRQLVWAKLAEIPYGELVTYGDIAKAIEADTGKKRSARAVGGAVGHNPVSIILPCHRVVGASRSLTGYAGGIERKIALLKLEGVDMGTLTVPTKGTAL